MKKYGLVALMFGLLTGVGLPFACIHYMDNQKQQIYNEGWAKGVMDGKKIVYDDVFNTFVAASTETHGEITIYNGDDSRLAHYSIQRIPTSY